MTSRFVSLSVLIASACSPSSPGESSAAIKMDFTRAASFYDAPFPSDDLVRFDQTVAGGSATQSPHPIDLSKFPNPYKVAIMSQSLALLTRDARGFAVSGGVYFSLTQDIGAPVLPDLAGSTASDASIFLLDLDRQTRHPVLIRYVADGGPFGAPNLLSLLPYQGIPLRSGARYAAVVRRTFKDGKGLPLPASAAVGQIASGATPEGLSSGALAEYTAALTTLAAMGIASSDITALSVFTTDQPEAGFATFLADVLKLPLPQLAAPFVPNEVFPTYCVYSSTISLPDYQQGVAPYSNTGGDWQLDAAGDPVAPHQELARIVATVPRTAMPAKGYPMTMLVRTGAGGDRPLVDRGVQGVTGGPPLAPGTGPAQEFAAVGFAGLQFDGPLGGLRNTTGGNEDFLIFNVLNVAALRDNVRESALELALMAHVLPTLTIDSSACPGASPTATFDTSTLALFGHSMGSSISPLAVAWEPLFRALILSGAGASYIENVLWKLQPLDVLPIAETLLDYDMDDRDLTESDPALTLFQWAAEPSDSQVYAYKLVGDPSSDVVQRRDQVLMEQGIVDHYIEPAIANAVSMPLGLDLGGMALDENNPAYVGQTPILQALPLVGHGEIALPATGNITFKDGTKATAIVVQHPSDGIEDGHEIIFQTEPPKHQYRCFLDAFNKGQTPTIYPDAASDAPCQ